MDIHPDHPANVQYHLVVSGDDLQEPLHVFPKTLDEAAIIMRNLSDIRTAEGRGITWYTLWDRTDGSHQMYYAETPEELPTGPDGRVVW